MNGKDDGMRLERQIVVENRYSGSDWNYEKTTKYIFEEDSRAYEAGYFEHYRDDVYVKSVIELPVSYGCPSKCKFCASSAISDFCEMTADQMMELFSYIYEKNHLAKKAYVLLTLTGTGDLFYNFSNVKQFLLGLTDYKNLHVTLSSCLWNQAMLREIEELSQNLSIRNVQVTFVSDRQAVLSEMIPVYQSKPSNFSEVFEYIEGSEKSYYRINYILMQGINDSLEDWKSFVDKVSGVKDKIVVRISRLNETMATERNGLCPADMEIMEQFRQYAVNLGIRCYKFYAYKNDHMNCGQLITEKK